MKPTGELTHLALWVSDLDASIEFYRKFAGMSVQTQRQEETGTRVAWISDAAQRLILVLIGPYRMPLRRRFLIALMRRIGPPSHIGVECTSRDEIRQLCDMARAEGILRVPATERGVSTGFIGIIADPDGNDLELSFGQNTRKYLRTETAGQPASSR